MATRCNWFLDDLRAVEDAPEPSTRVAIEQVGVRLSLAPDLTELREQFFTLADREAAYSRVGVECALKDNPNMTCSACSLRGRIEGLCDIGAEQEAVLSLITALEHGVDVSGG